jgi:hypothetical protein
MFALDATIHAFLPPRMTATLLRLFYAACLAGATYNHITPILAHGWRHAYGTTFWPVALYWNALTFIDPLTIALLFLKRRAGILLLVVLMLSDVTINTAMTIAWSQPPDARYIEQCLFLLIVLTTARLALRHGRA